MGKTSTAVKQRYLDKAYKQWTVRLKPELYDSVEAVRGNLSRSEFLEELVNRCLDEKNREP